MTGRARSLLCTAVALAVLTFFGCANKVERNIQKLASGNKEDRDEALIELMLAKQSAISPLVEALADHERPPSVRVDLVEALFRMYVRESDPQIVPALLAHVNDPSAQVRARIAIALADANVKEAVTPLLERLLTESDAHALQDLLTAVEILDEWRIAGRGGGVLTITGGENMTEEQRRLFVETLKRIAKDQQNKELSQHAEELLEKVAQQMVQESHKYLLKADLTRAEQKLLEAQALVPNSANVKHSLGRFYFDNGWPNKGLAILEDMGRVIHTKRLSRSPIIDGDLSDQTWKDATHISQFYQCIRVMRIVPAEGHSEVYVGRAGENLYIAVKGYEESTKDLAAVHKQRDSPAWLDDCGEVYLDTNHDYNTFYQIVVNSLGTLVDLSYGVQNGESSGGTEWNGAFRAAAKVEEGFWAFEIEIPIREVAPRGVKRGDIWGFNVARVRIAHKGEHDQWVPTYGAALRPDLFGFLVFD